MFMSWMIPLKVFCGCILNINTINYGLIPCVCYLPPENSSRRTDANVFYDTLLADLYKYQNLGTIFICGDFNGRCGNLEDFISGVDNIEHRNVIDFKTNLYGEILIEFLINSYMCMLNFN